jgi:hypothetical protein
MSDTNSRAIILSLAAVLILTVAALIASLFIPFNVDEPATIQLLTGEAEIITPGQPTVSAADQARLNINQTLNMLPGSEAQIDFAFDYGRAHLVLYGPAQLTLVESYHRATALGHVLSRRHYVLTLEQTQGSIHYSFAGTDPSFAEADVTIHLPNGDYTPDSPCWRIDIPLSGEPQIESFDSCNG